MNLYDGQGECVLIDAMGTDITPAQSARVSFAEDDLTLTELTDRDARLIRYLAEHRHTSPFEHMVATFRITVPLYVARQVMRHRTFSYNEVSRRYTAERVRCHSLDELRRQHKVKLQCSEEGEVENERELLSAIEEHTRNALALYQRLIEADVAQELARAVLPQSMFTSFWMTGSLRNWAHFLELRLDAHAQPETQELARAIRDQLRSLWPVSLSALIGDP